MKILHYLPFFVLVLTVGSVASQSTSCNVSVQAVPRSGGYWFSGGDRFQIYDIVITNTARSSIDSVNVLLSLPQHDIISQSWNYIEATGEILGMSSTLALGQSYSGAGVVIQGPAPPQIAFIQVNCVGGSCNPAPPPVCTSSTYTGNFLSIAFSPSTGTVGTSTGSGGLRVGYSVQTCSGEPPTVTDCIPVLVCIDCYGAISVTAESVNNQYLSAVATGDTQEQADELAYQECLCLAASTGFLDLTCSAAQS